MDLGSSALRVVLRRAYASLMSAAPLAVRFACALRWALRLACGSLLGAAALAVSAPVTVEIRGEAGSYQLYRGGEPYAVRGAGAQSIDDLESLARHGANSVRTWAVGDGSVLDRAQTLGLTVALCLNLERERHGFDYSDAAAVREQFNRARAQVLAHRHHPALLVWIIGNELNHDYRNPAVYDAVNDVAKMIHELDPHHPTTTATAGIDRSLANVIQARAPDLDFLSIQVYGGLFGLPEALSNLGLTMPLMVTEWGTKGHWEVSSTAWGAPLEPTSTAKAQRFWDGYQQVLAPMAGQLIGNYAFLWGQKQERTPTWYGVFTPDGRRTEAADVLQRIWTGRWPANRAPQLHGLRLDGKSAADNVRLAPGGAYVASAQAADPDQDRLTYDWRLMRESDATQVGGDVEDVPEELRLSNPDSQHGEISWRAPERPGAYRLYVYVGDGKGGAAHANVPFLVVEG